MWRAPFSSWRSWTADGGGRRLFSSSSLWWRSELARTAFYLWHLPVFFCNPDTLDPHWNDVVRVVLAVTVNPWPDYSVVVASFNVH